LSYIPRLPPIKIWEICTLWRQRLSAERL